jgi:hypothetical protein
VVLARPELPKPIWDQLNLAGYYRQVPENENQRFGWQEEARDAAEKVRSLRLSSNESLGLLPVPGKRVHEDECLLLVEVNYQWLVLSELGLHGRAGGQKLLRRENIYFVANELEGWAIYELIPRRSVDQEGVRTRWGGPAAHRAREGASSLVVSAQLIEAGLPR